MENEYKVLKVNSAPLYSSFTIGKAARNTVAPWPTPVKQSLRNFQRRGAFVAAFPIENLKMFYQKKFTPPLAIASKFFHCAFADPCMM